MVMKCNVTKSQNLGQDGRQGVSGTSGAVFSVVRRGALVGGVFGLFNCQDLLHAQECK